MPALIALTVLPIPHLSRIIHFCIIVAWNCLPYPPHNHNSYGILWHLCHDMEPSEILAVQRAVAALGGGRLVCPICPRAFPSAAELSRHAATAHRLDKLYWCQQCHYRSDSKSNLLRHLRTHTGEKRHGCPICPYRAGQRSDLRRHLRVHALRQPHNALQCRLCDFTTPSTVAFALHILESHSDKSHEDTYNDS